MSFFSLCKKHTAGFDPQRSIPITLFGNPNVGKSSIFNLLTGQKQHTGNWSGKTVACATGTYVYDEIPFHLTDLPGCYSVLYPSSQEEEIARDYLVEHASDTVVIVCDATCLERNLLIVLQVMRLAPKAILCINLMDEAKRRHITIHQKRLEEMLQVPVIFTCAHTKEGIRQLKEGIKRLSTENHSLAERPFLSELKNATDYAHFASMVAEEVIACESQIKRRDYKIDRIVTGKWTAFPIMFLLLAFIFFLTIYGANLPSDCLHTFFAALETPMYEGLLSLGLPLTIANLLIYGLYRVVTWIVSVMLPPMAIFFPLFAFLEDLGFLPRIAFNLDGCFCKCKACGKQALCMCMGLGCNAVGVTGCRIIDSPRERMIAILTNVFMPCNGRFPTLILLTTCFFAGSSLQPPMKTLTATLLLSGMICFCVWLTLAVSRLLSMTILRGMPSAFTLELPPYRRPQLGRLLLRTWKDKTLRILGRAVLVAAPAGILLWGMANIRLETQPLIQICTNYLDPFARFFGLDGVILFAFLLGMPANEIVVPIIIMCYLSGGTLMELADTSTYLALFSVHGWGFNRMICTILFTLVHWPCTTTLLTIRKETGSKKWTLIAFWLPTLLGLFLCAVVHHLLLFMDIY